jgi:hypothetical protein
LAKEEGGSMDQTQRFGTRSLGFKKSSNPSMVLFKK